MNRTYSAGDITINWNGIDLSSGWAEAFLTITPLVDRKGVTQGSDGQLTFSKYSVKGATIELTLIQTSETNSEIAKIDAIERALGGVPVISPFSVKDEVGKTTGFVALNATLTGGPTHEWGNDVGEKTWTWTCETFIDTEDPATVLGALDKYIR